MSSGAEADAAPAAREAARHGPRSGRRRNRRRRLLINPRYQLRASLLAVGVVVTLLVLVNLSFYLTGVRTRGALIESAPELEAWVRAQERVQLDLILVGAAVFLVGVFAVALLESHRSAGAAFQLGRKLGEIADGRLDTRLRLRRRDHLRELETAFNRMARALGDRARNEAETLEGLAGRAESLPGEDAGRLAASIRELATAKRRLLD